MNNFSDRASCAFFLEFLIIFLRHMFKNFQRRNFLKKGSRLIV